MVSRKPDIVILSYSSEDFPGFICYSGSRSHLMEAIPLLEDDINIALIRAWRWLPFPPKSIGESKIIVNSGGIVEKICVKNRFSRMYLYTPIIIVVMYDRGWVEIDGLKINIPECYKMSEKRFYLNSRRIPPTAILLSGRLDDIVDWIKGERNGINIEYKHVYREERFRITALRFSSRNAGYIDILVKDINGNKCGRFRIPFFRENGIFKTNAALIITEKDRNILDINGYRIEV